MSFISLSISLLRIAECCFVVAVVAAAAGAVDVSGAAAAVVSAAAAAVVVVVVVVVVADVSCYGCGGCQQSFRLFHWLCCFLKTLSLSFSVLEGSVNTHRLPVPELLHPHTHDHRKYVSSSHRYHRPPGSAKRGHTIPTNPAKHRKIR